MRTSRRRTSVSGKDEDFVVFREQFEARMHMLNQRKCLEDKLILPAYKENETRREETAGVKAGNQRMKQRFTVWCKLVQCLDRASLNFIRLHKPDRVNAWKAIVGKHHSTRGPAHSAGLIEDGTRGKGDRPPHQG